MFGIQQMTRTLYVIKLSDRIQIAFKVKSFSSNNKQTKHKKSIQSMSFNIFNFPCFGRTSFDHRDQNERQKWNLPFKCHSVSSPFIITLTNRKICFIFVALNHRSLVSAYQKHQYQYERISVEDRERVSGVDNPQTPLDSSSKNRNHFFFQTTFESNFRLNFHFVFPFNYDEQMNEYFFYKNYLTELFYYYFYYYSRGNEWDMIVERGKESTEEQTTNDIKCCWN